MPTRTYDQYCGLAGALDLVGERWTLLVVRELMSGPKRYTDLVDSLRGIGTSLLASRLKKLENDGVIERHRLPPPAASTVYRLTLVGDELARALMPLISWGLRHAVPEHPGPTTQVRAEWSLISFIHVSDPSALDGIDATFEFQIDGTSAYLRVQDSKARILTDGSACAPDATISLDASTVAAVGSGSLSATEAVASGRVRVRGDVKAVEALAGALG